MRSGLLFFILILGWVAQAQSADSLNYRAFCFYYNWYGNKATDAKLYHWAHPVMPQNDKDTTKKMFEGNGDIGANFYPQSGEYSSADTQIIEQHVAQIAAAGIGVMAVTWLGADDYTYRSVRPILNAAYRHHIKVCFQIEPVVRKTVLTTKDAIVFLINEFGTHPAYYRDQKTGRPLFFIYDSYMIPAMQWAQLLADTGRFSIRHTAHDADIIGLWVNKEDEQFFIEGSFDGMYTYFASSGFTFGSTPANWKNMQLWADKHNKKFIPSVGPGYNDNRIRPWNSVNTKSRRQGKYYDEMFAAALQANLKMIGITSFNEWHEGTQIEPAIPFNYNGFHYESYAPLSPDFYLKRTKYWLSGFGK
jgi:glycoprotein endo-alpha-1,2-mannosidase